MKIQRTTQNRMSLPMTMAAFAVALGALLCMGSSPARAQDPTLLGTYGAWSAYAFKEGGNKICYMASTPEKAEGNYSKRDEVFALITHRPAEGTTNVFSYITGYPYKPGSDARVKIGGTAFTLFTQDETAWAPDAETDNRLAKAVRAGSKMVVTGTSKRGTLTTDTFSLKGSSSAHDRISKECGVNAR